MASTSVKHRVTCDCGVDYPPSSQPVIIPVRCSTHQGLLCSLLSGLRSCRLCLESFHLSKRLLLELLHLCLLNTETQQSVDERNPLGQAGFGPEQMILPIECYISCAAARAVTARVDNAHYLYARLSYHCAAPRSSKYQKSD